MWGVLCGGGGGVEQTILYHISLVIRLRSNSPKNLDQYYKMDLHFQDYNHIVHVVDLHKTDLDILGHPGDGKTPFYSQIQRWMDDL